MSLLITIKTNVWVNNKLFKNIWLYKNTIEKDEKQNMLN